MILIGLHGDMESGKDAAAEYLASAYHFHRISVGAHIRRELCKADWLADVMIPMPQSTRELLALPISERAAEMFGKPTSARARESLQWFGNYMLSIHPNHWVSQIRCQIRDSAFDRIVLTDMRLPDEHDLIKGMGGYTIHISRKSRQQNEAAEHITETALDNYIMDFNIDNSGTLLALYDQIDDVMITLLERGKKK